MAPRRRLGIFDDRRPPDRALVDDCVHCGFCLPACPTYTLWGEERDSPRGRIHLMELGLDGEASFDPSYVEPFDHCLGCMACVPACPSGVQYAPLLEATRAQIERRRPPLERGARAVLLRLLTHRGLLRVVTATGWLLQRLGLVRAVARLPLPALFREALRVLPEVTLDDALGTLAAPRRVAAPRRRVVLLEGCVQGVLFRRVHEATLQVLAAEGVEVVVPELGCCGALAAHAGDDGHARRLARDLIDALDEVAFDHLVVNSAGCGSSLKELGHLLGDDPVYRVRAERLAAETLDVLELLAALPARATRHPLPLRVAYHDPCHLAHAQGIRDGPRRLLAAIPELELVEVEEGALCCGSAGIYNLTQPDAAEALGRRKAEHVDAAEADRVAVANPGCAVQIARYLEGGAHVVHPLELLAESIGDAQDLRG